MNSAEKEEIKRLPKKYRPMSALSYILYSLFWSVPIIGWISFIRNAVKGKNICKRNYARSYIIVYVLSIIIGIVLGVLFALDMLPMIDGGNFDNFNSSDISFGF